MRINFIKLILNISLSGFFVLMVCGPVQAQSGRRAPKPLSPPTITTPSKESEQPPAPKPTPKQQTVFAGMELSLDIPSYMSDAVWNGFIERFNKVSSIVINANKNMNRKDASERAKKSTESPVILLQVSTQSVGGNVWQVNFEDVIVIFSLYTPGTGKVSEQGRVYIGRNRSILGQRLPTGRNGEAQLKEAGREAANRVLSLLHIGDGNLLEGVD